MTRKPRAPGIKWNEAALTKLDAMYPTTPNSQIARVLGTTPEAVQQKASKRGLKKARSMISAMRVEQHASLARARAKAERVRTTAASEVAHIASRCRRRAAITALVERGVDDMQAELAVDCITRGLVPGVRFEV